MGPGRWHKQRVCSGPAWSKVAGSLGLASVTHRGQMGKTSSPILTPPTRCPSSLVLLSLTAHAASSLPQGLLEPPGPAPGAPQPVSSCLLNCIPSLTCLVHWAYGLMAVPPCPLASCSRWWDPTFLKGKPLLGNSSQEVFGSSWCWGCRREETRREANGSMPGWIPAPGGCVGLGGPAGGPWRGDGNTCLQQSSN